MRRKLDDYRFGDAYYGRIPKEQADKMALLWGEGSEKLTSLIRYCINNDIKTFTSCKGHGGFDQAYIGFQKMPKEFYLFMMEQMQDYRGVEYDIGRLGDQKPSLSIHIFDRPEYREKMFGEILEKIKEYTIQRNNLDLSGVKPIFVESVNYLFSKEGEGKTRIIYGTGVALPYETNPEYAIDIDGKVEYYYSRIARFCRASQETLSAIRDIPKKIREQLSERKEEINR